MSHFDLFVLGNLPSFGQNLTDWLKTELGPVLFLAIGVVALFMVIKRAYLALGIFTVAVIVAGIFFVDPEFVVSEGAAIFKAIFSRN